MLAYFISIKDITRDLFIIKMIYIIHLQIKTLGITL